MLLVDIVLVLLVLGAIGASAKDGFVRACGHLAGAVLGYYVAQGWSGRLQPWFSAFMPSSWAKWVAFVLVFLLIWKLAGYLVRLADGAFRILSFLPFLKGLNTLLGGIVGVLEAIVIFGGAITVTRLMNVDPQLTAALNGSTVAKYLGGAFQAIMLVLF